MGNGGRGLSKSCFFPKRPVHRPARLRLCSKDTLYSFSLLFQRITQDVVPGSGVLCDVPNNLADLAAEGQRRAGALSAGVPMASLPPFNFLPSWEGLLNLSSEADKMVICGS